LICNVCVNVRKRRVVRIFAKKKRKEKNAHLQLLL